MHRAGALLIVLILLAPTALAQTDPNRRKEPALTGNGDFQEAAIADFSRHVIGGTLDPPPSPGVGLPSENLHGDVWKLWDAAGGRLQAGHADSTQCDAASANIDPEALITLCDGDAVAVAMSQDGSRAVVASHISASKSRVLLITAQQGLRHSLEVAGIIHDVDMDGPGDTVALAIQGTGGEVPHRVQVFGWLAPTRLLVEKLPSEAPTRVDLATDGGMLVYAAGKSHRVLLPGGTETNGAAIQSQARDVAVSSDSAHWSVAGYASGEVAVYSRDHSATHAFSRHPSNQAQLAVAIREDATAFAAGDAVGTLRFYSLDRDAATGALADTRTLEGSITDLAFSRDGKFLMAGTSQGFVALYSVGAKLQPLWTDLAAGPVASVDLSADGEVAAVAAGTEVLIYPALHRLQPRALDAVSVAPGASQAVSVEYQNLGNRAETVDIQTNVPDGWNATATPATFNIALLATAGTSVEVAVPALTPPGRYSVGIQHVLGGSPGGEVVLLVDVPEAKAWELTAGAPSMAVSPGMSVAFPAVVRNVGNVLDRTGLAVVVDRSSWSATVAPATVELEPGESANVTVTLNAPPDAAELEGATATLSLAADPRVAFAFTGKVGAAFQPKLIVASTAKVVQGQSILVPITVQNDGNAPDSFDVTVTGSPLLWTTVFETGLPSHRFTSVAAGQSATVNLKVQAPFDADVNQTVVLRASVQSLGDATKSDARTFLIGVQPAEVAEIEPPAKESPGASLLAVLLLVVALAARRSSGPRP